MIGNSNCNIRRMSMNRISLPGKAKNKRIILFILILISVGILIYEFINNTKIKILIKILTISVMNN